MTFWHPLADMLSAYYPRVHYCYMLYKCQENSWQPALMLSVLLTQSVFFLTSLSSNSAWISGPKKHLSCFWRRNLFIKCWNELHFLSILTIVQYFQCQGYYLISHRNLKKMQYICVATSIKCSSSWGKYLPCFCVRCQELSVKVNVPS